MTGMMHYKGYDGSVRYHETDGVLFGKVEFIRALVSYEGIDIVSLRKAFAEAVDDYLELCREEGKEPEKPYKGSFNIRIPPETHRKIAMKAAAAGISINSYVAKVLENAA